MVKFQSAMGAFGHQLGVDRPLHYQCTYPPRSAGNASHKYAMTDTGVMTVITALLVEQRNWWNPWRRLYGFRDAKPRVDPKRSGQYLERTL